MQGLYAGVWCTVKILSVQLQILNLCFDRKALKQFDLIDLQFVFINCEISLPFSVDSYANRN